MAEKVPIRAAYDGSDACGLSELQDGEVIGVEHGGLGVCTLTTHGVLLGNTQGSVQVSGALTTNGQILIGGTSGPSVASITGTSNVEITAGDGTLAIGLPSAVSGLTTISSTNLCATTLLNTAGLCVNSAYSFPTSDGTAGYIFCTDGSGSISFAENDGKLTIANAGSALASRQCLNFIGAAVTAADNSGTNATDVTVCATTASIGLREADGTQCCVTLSSATVGELLCVDGSPQLGGNLDVTGHSLITTSNNNMTFCPHGSGKIILDNLCWPTADGSAGQIICTDGSGGLSFADDAGGSPGGSNTQLQFNNSSAFGGSSDLTWDGSVLKTTSVCTTGNTIIGGDLTIAGDDLTMGTNTSGYIMVADGTNYNPVAVSGDVSINAAGAVTIAATSVENSMLAGSIANAKLSNSTVSYGGVSLSLGGSDGTPAFDLSDATAYAGDSSLVTVGTISSGSWQGTAVASGYIASTLTGKTLTSPVLNGTLSGTAFLDEDNMASNSAIAAASQQSIKAYVDSVASGLDLKDSVHASTTAALSADYSNGSSGVGATLTNNSTQEALSIDGQTLATSERVLVKDQSTASQNGIYSVTTAGDGSTNWVLTRTTDFDTPTEVTSGAFTFVETGSSNADSGWVMTTDGSVTIGTTSLAWSQFSGAGQITAGAGMTKSGNTLNVIAGDNITVNANDVALSTTITGLTALTSTTLTGTLATAAQANITSLGTLSSLDVSGDLTIDTTSLAVDSSNNRVGIGTATPSHLLDVDGVANIATCVITPVVCINSEYVLPSSDGTAGQIVCTDGSGATTFADAASSGHTISEEGSVLASRTCLNFIGAAVTAADNSGTNATDVTVCATNALFGIRAADGTACTITLSNAAIGECLQSDTSPKLGGSLDVNSNSIISASNGNIPITPNGSGIVIIDGLCHPTADGSAGQILCTDGSAALKFATASAGVTLAGSTNNTIATVTGSDALCGEANLTFDGSTLAVTGGMTLSSTSTISGDMTFVDNAKVTLGTGGDADLYYDGTDVVLDPSVVGTGNFVVQVASSGADPNVKGLMVENSSSAAITIGSGTTSEGMLHFADSGAPNSGRIVYAHNENDMYFATAATERMRIDSSGRVGIGTASMSQKLDIRDDNDGLEVVTICNAANCGRGLYLNVGCGNTNHGIITAQNNPGTAMLKFTGDGQLGIGTAAPAALLHVEGTTGVMQFDPETTVSSQLKLTSTSGRADFGTYNGSHLAFLTDSTERMRITTAGYVGINRTNPTSPLYVQEDGTDGLHTQTIYKSDSSAVGNLMFWATARSSSTAYNFLSATSGGGSQQEILITGNGNGKANGTWQDNSYDYAEYFESATGIASELGRAVVLDDGKMRYYDASTDDATNIIGITRPKKNAKGPSIHNVAWNGWHERYITDDFGQYEMEDVTVWSWDKIDAVEASEGVEAVEGRESGSCYERDEADDWTPPEGATSSLQSVRKQNPDYDPTRADDYKSREDRDEWWLIGLLGQVQIKVDEPTHPRWIKMKNISDAVEMWMIR